MSPSAAVEAAAPRSGQDGPEPSTGGQNASTQKPALRIHFPPVKEKSEVLREQRAAVSQAEIRKGMESDIPPVIRSVLELSHLMMSGHSQWLRGSPGYQGGLFYRGKPYCFASGYRDGTRPRDMEDKGNHMRLKDPLNYGCLSLPVTAAYLCELHGTKVFDLEAPLLKYLPELESKIDSSVSARSILAFTTVLNDKVILKDAGAHAWRPLLAVNACAATQRYVCDPVNRFFSAGSRAPVDGRQQRANLVQYVRSSSRLPRIRQRIPSRAAISHFSVALLMAAVETQLKGVSFEDSIRTTFFEPAQSHGAGYGAPKLWRDPNQMFYQPSGLALQHQTFRRPVPSEAPSNCGPALWNASLNLYAPVEDYGKLLLLSLDTILDARKLIGCFNLTTPHYDFGVWHNPSSQLVQHKEPLFRSSNFIPASSSFRFNSAHDLGCFGIASCGTRSARLFANNLSRMIQHLFVKHVLKNEVEADKPLDLDNPTAQVSETTEKFQKIMKDQHYTSYFKKHDAHRRF